MKQSLKDILLNKTFFIDSRGIAIDTLLEINNGISQKDDIKLILSCDYSVITSEGRVNNLDILQYLNNITRLAILNHSSKSLSNIGNVRYIHDLTEFELGGFISQCIDLQPLMNYNLKSLDLELNATSDIYKLVLNNNLRVLKINSFDLQYIKEAENLVEFEIKKNLYNAELIQEKMPSIETIRLNNLKKTSDFSFLSRLKFLNNISLRNTPIILFPVLNVDRLVRVELVRNNKLVDILSFFELDSIERIFISQCDRIPLDMLKRCANINNLKQFYLLTSKQKNGSIISEILEGTNIKKTANAFWD